MAMMDEHCSGSATGQHSLYYNSDMVECRNCMQWVWGGVILS